MYPVEVSNLTKNEMEFQGVICKSYNWSRDPVQGTTNFEFPFYYASIYDLLCPTTTIDQTIRQYVVLRRKPLQDAYDTFNFLTYCEHPNVLKPYGFWENDSLGFITFPVLDGTLGSLPKEELFYTKISTAENKPCLNGFSENGIKAFREIVSAMHYVNERYPRAGTSSSGSATTPPISMLPLQLGSNRIFYEKISTGEYKNFLGDIFTCNHWPKQMKKNPSVEDLKRLNWNGLGDYILTLMKDHNSNEELNHLAQVLKMSNVTLEDIMWEPALWGSKVKMRFIRDVAWCLVNDETGVRKKTLSKLASLGLQDCIDMLGVNYNEAKNLLSSVMLLRNKLVAHHDDTYRNYPGPKEQVGLAKATLEKFLLDRRPDYTIKLIAEIRKLGWMRESPLIRSMTNYVKAFDPNRKTSN